ncbi:uncharacterized protein LW93_12326 [Fusarium fujikuroi]|nr:uncharacterized protein LW93_12326 [Fusarium fujikuroi]
MSGTAAIRIAKSLSKKSIIRLVLSWGPQAIMGLQAMFTQHKEGKAAVQKEMTYKEIQEAIPKLLEIIEQKEIRLVPNAFNSHPEFIACFQASAIAAVPLILLDLTQSIRRIGASLDEIKSELAISNIARVQGWADDGFGTYVHRFVQNQKAPLGGIQGALIISSMCGILIVIGIRISKEDRERIRLVPTLVAIITT